MQHPPLETFAGRPVKNYDPEVGLASPGAVAPRLHSDVYIELGTRLLDDDTRRIRSAIRIVVGIAALAVLGYLIGVWTVFPAFLIIPWMFGGEGGQYNWVPLEELIDDLAEDPGAPLVDALVLGEWDIASTPEVALQRLVARADRFPELRALFIGDFNPSREDVHHLEDANLGPLLRAFELTVLEVRVDPSARLHFTPDDRLERLVIQTAGFTSQMVRDLCEAKLPRLRHLEIWCGDPRHGYDAKSSDFARLWDPSLFGALETLAIRDCPNSDGLARRLAEEPEAWSRLRRIDLSGGTLTDAGVEALASVDTSTSFDLSGNPDVSDVGLAMLKSSGAEVDHDQRVVLGMPATSTVE